MSALRNIGPTQGQKAFRDDLIAVIGKHAHLSAEEILACAAHLVGQLVALQDHQHMTPDMAMEMVARNIEAGNADALDGLLQTQGTA
jgi:hypothetical protein